MVEQVTRYRAPTAEVDADAVTDWLRARVDDGVTVGVCERALSLYADDGLTEDNARTTEAVNGHTRQADHYLEADRRSASARRVGPPTPTASPAPSKPSCASPDPATHATRDR